MAKLSLKQGTTSKRLRFYAEHADGTGPFTGLLYNTALLTAYYCYEGDTQSRQIVLVTGGVLGTWASGTLLPVDGVNMPGVYELGLPNACLAAGASVDIVVQGAANLATVEIEIELTAVDNQSATAFVSSVPSVVGAVGSVTGAVGSVASVVSATLGSNEDTALARLYAMTDTTPKLTTTALSQAPSGTGASAVSIRQEIDLNSTQLAKLGTPVTSVSADIAAIETNVLALPTSLLDFANGVETGMTLRQVMRLFTSILAGKATDSGGVYTLKRQDGTTTAVTITHDANGNRTNVVIGSL